MVKVFWFLDFGRPAQIAPVRPHSAAAYADALLAGWVPPLGAPSETRVQAGPALSAEGHTPDSVTFLARVYRHQEC